MVGFHDLLCTFIWGHQAVMKFSSKDDVLIPAVLEILTDLDPRIRDQFEKVDKLSGFDAVIATGGETASVHFEYYFSKYPHIIRSNRSSVALLQGNESKTDIEALGSDVFDYFGLGCRSISKVYIPEDFDTDRLFEGFYRFAGIENHNKYKNNYDYNCAIYLVSREPILTNGFIILRESRDIASRIACLHYERYDDLEYVAWDLDQQAEKIQCVVSQRDVPGWEVTGFGQSQKPSLGDYADNVDTMEFLAGLKN